MLEIAYRAGWFHSADQFTDILSIIVLVVIALYAYQFYRLHKKRQQGLLALAFSLMAAAYLGKIISNYLLFSDSFAPQVIQGFISVQPSFANPSQMIFYVAFLSFRLLIIAAFTLWLSVYDEMRSSHLALFLFVTAILQVLTTYKYYVFYLILAAIIFTTLIAAVSRYKQSRAQGMRPLLFALACLFGSTIFAMLVPEVAAFYIVEIALQLIAFSALLYTFARSFSHG